LRSSWQNLVDQSIILVSKWVDEHHALQNKSVLQVLGYQMAHASTLRRSPQQGIPKRQSMRFHDLERGCHILGIRGLHGKYRASSIDYRAYVIGR
jgi:hypothetical protein